jgi:hypothetical protein
MVFTSIRKKNQGWKVAALLAIIFFTVTGSIFFALNYRLPLSRNSIVYAKISYLMIDSFNLFVKNYTKPTGFSIFSLPLVKVFGANIGLKISSFLFTTLFILITFFLHTRLYKTFKLPKILIFLGLFISFFNSLTFQQYFNGDPGPMYAFTFILSFLMLDNFIRNSTKKNLLIYISSVLIALTVKINNFLILVLHPVYVFMVWPGVKKILEDKKRLLLISLVVLVFSILFFIKFFSAIAFLFFRDIYSTFYFKDLFLSNVATLIITFFYLSFSFSTLFLFGYKYEKQHLPIIVFTIIFVVFHTLLMSSVINSRYYLPILPFVGLFIVNGVHSFYKSKKYFLLVFIGIIYLFFNALIILNYNSIAADNFFSEKGISFYYIHSFNLRSMEEINKILTHINRNTRGNGTVNIVVNYYDDAIEGIYQRDGLIRNDINLLYWSNIEVINNTFPTYTLPIYSQNYSNYGFILMSNSLARNLTSALQPLPQSNN